MLQVELDGDNYDITLTEELFKEFSWEVGDVLSFEDNSDGSVSLFKADPALDLTNATSQTNQ
jgi:hypothetical protein